jgi:hypothetical protein
MSLWKRGRQYWTDFTVNGRRYRKRLGTTNLRVATSHEGEMIEEAGHGRLPVDEQGPKRLSEAIDAYLTAKRIRCSARTIELEEERLSIVKKHSWPSVDERGAAAPVRRRCLESRMGARLLRRNRRGQHVDAACGSEAPSPVRCGSGQATAARSSEQERDEPSRDPAERVGH